MNGRGGQDSDTRGSTWNRSEVRIFCGDTSSLGPGEDE